MAIGAISSGPNNRQQRAEERILCYDPLCRGCHRLRDLLAARARRIAENRP